jgi:hypothetical protein
VTDLAERDKQVAHPVRQDAPTEPHPWRDNAYLGFWDPGHAVFGAVHVSTSPNSEGRRARASVSVRGVSAEVIEDLEPGTFGGRSITYDLDGTIRVRSRDLEIDLAMPGRHHPVDYTGGVITDLIPDQPLHHLQQPVHVVGEVSVRSERGTEAATVRGRGLRDRSWGFRDESVSMVEFAFFVIGLGDEDLSVMKFRRADGSTATEGFLLGGAPTAVHALAVTRDAAGLVVGADVGLEGGSELVLRRRTLHGGFWVPMGVERRGPTMSCYDEFVEVEAADGRVGHGIFEQGIRRDLF